MMQRAPGLYYAPSDLHDRGVFCTHALSPGDLIEVCPVLVLLPVEREWLQHSVLYQYYFAWGENLEAVAIALGYGSLYNHANQPNAEFIPDYSDDTILIQALEEIPPGYEITIDYHAGSPGKALWFERKTD